VVTPAAQGGTHPQNLLAQSRCCNQRRPATVISTLNVLFPGDGPTPTRVTRVTRALSLAGVSRGLDQFDTWTFEARVLRDMLKPNGNAGFGGLAHDQDRNRTGSSRKPRKQGSGVIGGAHSARAQVSGAGRKPGESASFERRRRAGSTALFGTRGRCAATKIKPFNLVTTQNSLGTALLCLRESGDGAALRWRRTKCDGFQGRSSLGSMVVPSDCRRAHGATKKAGHEDRPFDGCRPSAASPWLPPAGRQPEAHSGRAINISRQPGRPTGHHHS
jgi:hypothetical protein